MHERAMPVAGLPPDRRGSGSLRTDFHPRLHWLCAAIAIALSFVLCAAALAAPASGAIPRKADPTQNVYRFYNNATGVHFYTASDVERDKVRASYPQFIYEGAVFLALVGATQGAQPVWRFFNTRTGAHFYTSSATERASVIAKWPWFADEGIVFYAWPDAAADRIAVHRFYNNKTQTHFFTGSDAERDSVLANYPAFTYEGVAYYGLPVPPSPAALAKRDAFRLLDQATFGPTTADVARVVQIGAVAWIDEQIATPISGYPDTDFWFTSLDEADNCKFSAPRDSAIYACARDQLTLFKFRSQFFSNALNKPDQLRQRVAWALSQILVISGMKDPDLETGYVQARYHQLLAEEAFGNFPTLLTRVTLSPAMGHYLDMVDNAKADPKAGTEPNENFARELMQLFSIGLVELKREGTPLVDAAGDTIPTYGQAEIKALARALTGWTYPPFDAKQAKGPDDDRYFGKPMVSVPAAHDSGAKTLLHGATVPPGLTPDVDLALALSVVFRHPNVGPFIGKQLIRQLVTGNPSPAYVDRVAAAFDDNGSGVRGDMKAVTRAILLDPEARTEPVGNSRAGRFREPVLYATAFLRALGAASDGIGLDEAVAAMGQDVFYSPTVFNYYPAEFKIPGTSIVAPPLGIHNTNTVLERAHFVQDMIYYGGIGRDDEVPGSIGTTLAIEPYAALAGNPAALVAAIDDRLFGGAMPAGMRAELIATLAALDPDDLDERARAALFLAVTSFQFQVSR